MSGQSPPGWYRDPYGTPGLLRYWNGAQWTQASQPTDAWEAPRSPTTPQPWAAPQPRPWSTPQPWQPPPPARQGSNKGLLWGLIGGGALLVVLILVVGIVVGVMEGETSPTSTPTTRSAARSPVTGEINDDQAGLSLVRLGGDWSWEQLGPDAGFRNMYGFTWAELAVVQEKYDGTQSYYANAYTGRLPSSITYNGTQDLASATTTLAKTIEAEPEPRGAYPSHTRHDLESRAHTVGGNSAWYLRFRLDFPQARSRGWNFRSETAVMIVIDRGAGNRPSTVFISVPDSHSNGGDLDLLVNSIKAR
ncbi:DUF2510 domain-containing protein [Actinomadura rudentiformis]|uniref:DUF2510 domain-containing protein n=1 Tax=Actinomadura rudentiformis TaxID=359158 RepID=A0A6H9YUD9_9ACTN|nr:DUF2510 domain-containing protein [Actinomadura rudentiformis]KAB2347266.1 DUF2510 domain-containing protein [Actinomadura rudentiformis]